MSNAKRAPRASVVGYKTADGTVHLQPIGFFDPFSTLCGDCDVTDDYASTETSEECTCRRCLSTFNAIKNGVRIAKARVRS